MKATGIVRRIDDLGRVVIPKEIRRTLRIREGDPLEIYTMGEMAVIAGKYADVLARTTGDAAVICDSDHVVAAAGISKREVLERRISAELEQYLQNRKNFAWSRDSRGLVPLEGVPRAASVMCPILSCGDVLGAVALLSGEGEQKEPGETRTKLVQATAAFLASQMEEG